jgi:uncharacterized Zn-binding protein involved in type VI secretion
MIYKRFYIRAGATTTAGGVVRASSEFCILNGAPLAREGDPVDCPACATQGIVQCILPRVSDSFEGKEYALSDDLCICKCNPPPKLVADQNFDCQMLALASVETAEEAAARAISAREPDRMPMRFFDEATGKPHAQRAYRLELKDGGVLAGTTDADGCTKPLTQKERDALKAWHVAPASAEG